MRWSWDVSSTTQSERFVTNFVKIFNSGVYGPSGVGGLLAPYQRDRHNGKIINPTGGVDAKTGPGFQGQISSRGFFPVLGMSYPLHLVS